MRNNFFCWKSYTKCRLEANPSPRLFYEKIRIEHISESTVSNVLQFTLIVYPCECLPKYVKTKVRATCFDLRQRAFRKQKDLLHDC